MFIRSTTPWKSFRAQFQEWKLLMPRRSSRFWASVTFNHSKMATKGPLGLWLMLCYWRTTVPRYHIAVLMRQSIVKQCLCFTKSTRLFRSKKYLSNNMILPHTTIQQNRQLYPIFSGKIGNCVEAADEVVDVVARTV